MQDELCSGRLLVAVCGWVGGQDGFGVCVLECRANVVVDVGQGFGAFVKFS